MDERREKERIKAIRDKHPHLVGDTQPHNHTIREIIDIAPFMESVQTEIQAEIEDGHDHDGTNSEKVDWGNINNKPTVPDAADNEPPSVDYNAGTVGTSGEFAREDHSHDLSSHEHPTSEISDYPLEFPPEDHTHTTSDITDYVVPESGLRPSDLFGVGKDGYVIDPWELTENKNANDGYAGLNSSGYVAHGQLGSGGGGSSKFLREDNSWQTVSSGTSTTKAFSFLMVGT